MYAIYSDSANGSGGSVVTCWVLAKISNIQVKFPFAQALKLLLFSYFLHLITVRHICIAQTLPWQDVCLSVRLSIRHTLVLCLNDYVYPQSFFTVD